MRIVLGKEVNEIDLPRIFYCSADDLLIIWQ